MTKSSILASVEKYYTEKITANGPTARGVDWNSAESQQLRFKKLLEVCRDDARFSLNDYGCGYGALLDYLDAQSIACQYRGYDISPAMIEHARRAHPARPDVEFLSDARQLMPADYTVASGIFNVRLQHDNQSWQTYIEGTLLAIDALSRKGFAFNVLTSYSDLDRQRPDLYYADPLFWFDYCKKRYSRSVSLLHDYPLYEFTLLIRKSD